LIIVLWLLGGDGSGYGWMEITGLTSNVRMQE
jgi:hypothetical protein